MSFNKIKWNFDKGAQRHSGELNRCAENVERRSDLTVFFFFLLAIYMVNRQRAAFSIPISFRVCPLRANCQFDWIRHKCYISRIHYTRQTYIYRFYVCRWRRRFQRNVFINIIIIYATNRYGHFWRTHTDAECWVSWCVIFYKFERSEIKNDWKCFISMACHYILFEKAKNEALGERSQTATENKKKKKSERNESGRITWCCAENLYSIDCAHAQTPSSSSTSTSSRNWVKRWVLQSTFALIYFFYFFCFLSTLRGVDFFLVHFVSISLYWVGAIV